MFIPALLLPHQNLDPVAKYFLVRFVLRFGIVAPVQCGVKELAKMIGVSDRLVTKSLADLVGHGLLSHQAVSEGRGRPKSEYRCTPSFVAMLSEFSSSLSSPQKTVIAHLLERAALGDGRGRSLSGAADVAVFQDKMTPAERLANLRARKKSDRLSNTNRLLLAVLLTRADRFGVVSDFGSSELRKATGLSQERLRCGIDRLLNLGLIRAYVPGATSSVFFKKTKSVYFLNLHSPEMLSPKAPAVLVSVEQNPQDNCVWDQATFILESISAVPEQSFFKVRGFFVRKQEMRLIYLLRSRLECYASYLLTHHWNELLIDGYHEGLLQLIKDDFPSGKRVASSDFPTDEHYSSLAQYLHNEANWVARLIQGSLVAAEFPALKLEAMDYVALPKSIASRHSTEGQRTSVAVLAFAREPGVVCAGYHVATMSEGRKIIHRHFTCAEEISKEDRYFFGLQTSPGAALVR